MHTGELMNKCTQLLPGYMAPYLVSDHTSQSTSLPKLVTSIASYVYTGLKNIHGSLQDIPPFYTKNTHEHTAQTTTQQQRETLSPTTSCETMGTSKNIPQIKKFHQRRTVKVDTLRQQKLYIELRSSTGLPLEAPLEISCISLTYHGNILAECHTKNTYETYLQHSNEHHTIHDKISVNILKYGAIFLNGGVTFNIPYQSIDIKDLSVMIQYRSEKYVKADVVIIQNAQEHYFGDIAVSKLHSWEKSYLSLNKKALHTSVDYTYHDIIIDTISCINAQNEETSVLQTNEKFSFAIDYTVIHMNLFEQTQLVITIKEHTQTNKYTLLTHELPINPLSPTGQIVIPVTTVLSPGEYTVTVFLTKNTPYTTECPPLAFTTEDKNYHLNQQVLTINVIASSIEDQNTSYLENMEEDTICYN